MTAQLPRILSFQQIVLETDPDWQRSNLQPWIYSFSNTRLFYRQIPAYGAPVDGGLINDGGFVMLDDTVTYYPQSDAGLSAGGIYSNGGFVSVVPGATPQIGAVPLSFTGLTASQLLLFGGGNIPPFDPGIVDRLFSNGGFVNVSTGAPPSVPMYNDGGVLWLDPSVQGWATSSTGFPGAVWNNGLTVAVVPGVTPNPAAPPVFFGGITSNGLLELGGGDLPLTNPGVPNQLWNNGGLVCIS